MQLKVTLFVTEENIELLLWCNMNRDQSQKRVVGMYNSALEVVKHDQNRLENSTAPADFKRLSTFGATPPASAPK